MTTTLDFAAIRKAIDMVMNGCATKSPSEISEASRDVELVILALWSLVDAMKLAAEKKGAIELPEHLDAEAE